MFATAPMRLAAVLGALAVGLGAFGAHGLKAVLAQNQTAATWETAVFYHFIHAVALLVLATRAQLRIGAYVTFVIGIFVFSGSLYVLAVTGIKWLGAVTPIGGVSFIVGWLWLALKPGGS